MLAKDLLDSMRTRFWTQHLTIDWRDPGKVDPKAWLGLKIAVESWFFAYKNWERQDTFDAAFSEGRMTARGSRNATESGRVYDLMLRDSEGGRYVGGKLHVGFEGMTRRLKPENFEGEGKNEGGLHALPAVLLDPTKRIQPQLFGDPTYALFMPLPPEADIEVQYYLSSAAKELDSSNSHQNQVLETIRMIRRNMTRIHLASHQDMGTSFFNEGTEQKMKIRYGYAQGSDGFGERKDQKVIDEFRANALYYQRRKISDRGTRTGNNEVTVKYRKHAGNYPLFTRKVTKKDGTAYYEEMKGFLGPVNHNRRVSDRGKLEHWAWRGIIPAWVTFPNG